MHKRILRLASLTAGIAIGLLVGAPGVIRDAAATVSATNNTVTYTGNGVTTAFATTFSFLQGSDLVVTVAAVTKTLGTDFTVSGAGNATGTVTFAAAPANLAAVVITRKVDYLQKTSLKAARTYDPATVEKALDKLAMGEQQLQALYTNPPASVLPAQVAAKLNGIRFADQFADIQTAITDAGTTGVVLIPSTYAGSDTFTNPNAIPIIDLRGGVARWRGFPTVKDLGAVCDGSTDDSAKVQAAANLGGTIAISAGTCVVKGITVTVPNTTFIGLHGGTLKLKSLAALDGSPILDVRTTGVTIRDVLFDGNKASQPADGFSDSFNTGANGTGRAYRAAIKADGDVFTISNLRVQGASFQNTYGAAIAARNVSRLYALDNTCLNINFECVMAYGSGADAPTDLIISRNWGQNIGSGDATTNADFIIVHNYARAVVSDNVAQNIERNFVKLEAGSEVQITGNILKTNTKDNFGCIQTQSTVSNVLIANNVCSNVGAGINLNSTVTNRVSVVGNLIDTTTGSTLSDGINATVVPAVDLLIADNILKGVKRHGIFVADGTRVSIRNNHLTGQAINGQVGIYVIASTQTFADLDISGNYVASFQQQAGAGEGVVAFNRAAAFTFSNATVRNNVVLGGAAGNRGIRSSNPSSQIASGLMTGNYVDGQIELGTQVFPAWGNVSTGSYTGATGGTGSITMAAGTGTATVVAGCRPQCTNTSNANAVKCAVSGTTLTATGTGTDVINFLCM